MLYYIFITVNSVQINYNIFYKILKLNINNFTTLPNKSDMKKLLCIQA